MDFYNQFNTDILNTLKIVNNDFTLQDMFNLRNNTYNTYLVLSILYLPTIFIIKFIVDNFLTTSQKNYLSDILHYPFIIWTSILTIISGCGTFFLISHLFANGYDCDVLEGNTGYWIAIFLLSKKIELIDTIFIVLRSKPLILLQYYHHFATMVLCWMGFFNLYKETIIAASVNYLVHTFMYAYYTIYNLGYKKIRNYNYFITSLQFLQMVFVFVYLEINYEAPCYNYEDNNIVDEYTFFHVKMIYEVAYFVYGSYIFLFGKLFYDKLFENKNKDI